ncbi:Nlrc3 [Symbiodinium natans]|uniref:Nlrc3 protein n=1 Tax=Symbiodinium natans TaxID=878477 RepID=A0A812US03_9DINO|nr:Nlrc3 [Symbiodinium natans]
MDSNTEPTRTPGDSSAVRFPSGTSPGGSGDVVEMESSQAPPSADKELRFRSLTENTYALRQNLRPRGRDGLGEFRPDPGPGRGSQIKLASSQIRGFYLVKFAVSVTACYLTIQLLITFAEVLLPFIFAMLIVIVLEPLKKFVMRVFSRLVVRTLLTLRLDFCIENMSTTHGPADGRLPSVDESTPVYGSLPDDSTAEDVPRPVAIPIPAVKRFLVALSIAFCLVMSGRVLWLTAKVFFRAGAVISSNMDAYKQGAERLKGWVQTYIHDLHITSLDYGELLDELVAEVEHIGSVVTQSVIYTAVQAVVTFIFLIYMLWSPVKMDGSAVAAEVFSSTSRYLKVKCLTSAFTGLSIGVLLWAIGLDLPAAFGLLSFLANFLPGIGSPAASVLPCILAIIDVRKTPTQVLLAFVLQAIMHFFIDFVIEPVFFGISVEIHSVIVILGIWFFYQVWGVPGMLLSVPLLSVVRTAVERLASGLMHAPKVQRLVLEECRLDAEAAAVLAKPLAALTQLQILSLAHNQLEVGGAEALVRGLKEGGHAGMKLQELSLADNLLGPRAALCIAEVMLQFIEAESLVSVSLAENFFQEEGGGFLAGALRECRGRAGSLHLDLSANDLRVAGAKSLVPLLTSCSALGSLELHGNRIHDFGTVALAQALKGNSALTHLGLAENLVGDDGAVAIAGVLSNNRSLRTLDLCGGQGQVIRDKGALALAEALRSNTTLEGLELDGNAIAEAGGHALEMALSENQGLTSLTLRGNQFDYTAIDGLMGSRVKHLSL